MSNRYVIFENGSFLDCGSDPIAPTEMGRSIVDALLGRERYTVDGTEPDYAVDFLRHTGRNGGCDFHTQSDEFEWSIREARTLKEKANELERMLESDELRDSGALALRSEDLGFCSVYEALRASIDQLRTHAGSLYGTGGRQRISQRYHLPALRPGAPLNDPDVIYYDPRTKTWNFGAYQVGVNKLGRIIALSLLANKEVVDMGDMHVTVNYLVEMVRITGIHGRFRDVCDGAFNMYAPAGASRKADSRL